MRGVAYALMASGVLAIGAWGPASASCYRDCDDDYRSSTYRPAPSYDRYERYAERPVYRESYRESYRERPTYYEPPRYRTTYYERPAYRTVHYKSSYDDDYYERPRYRHHHRSHYRSHHSYHPTVRYGGGWSQTYPAYAYWGGCHTAYIPYGWTWYRARSC